MWWRPAGFTMVEMLVVVGVLCVLTSIITVVVGPVRTPSRRSMCGNNLGNLIKCCHLYSDSVGNAGLFPVHRSYADTNGVEAMNLLYNGYVKDHRCFACPSSMATGRGGRTGEIPRFTGNQWIASRWMTSSQTNYGYDPGHSPVDGEAGILADWSDDADKNSSNHGEGERPGQNVAIGAGSVEWWDSPMHKSSDGSGDRLYRTDGLPMDMETFIVQ